MTIRDVVKELKSLGNDVEFVVRADGGIRITKINGQRFKGSKGNQIAREMTGQVLSERRAIQLKRAGKVAHVKSRKQKDN